MSRVSQHLHAFHKASHEDRTQAIANCKAALDKAAGMEPAGGPTTAFLQAEIDRHTSMQEHHAAKMEECAKAVTAEAEKAAGDAMHKLAPLPDGLSTTAPDRPEISLVPRFGQRVPSTTPVEPGFEKLVAIEEE